MKWWRNREQYSSCVCTLVRRCLVLYLFHISKCTGAPDNVGTDFILIYMDNYATSYSSDLELYVTTGRPINVNVHVTSPLSTSPNVDQQFVVHSGYVHQLNISCDFRVVGSVMSNNAIFVQADDEVVVYAMNKEAYTNDAFLVLPLDVLGTEHFAASFHPATYRTQFAVVAAENCAVIITLSNPTHFLEVEFGGITYYNGESFAVNLNQYESMQMQSQGDLTGTHISSTKPVAVFSGNRRTRIDGYSSDHLVEQLPPVSTWGKKFALVPTPESPRGDLIKCVASQAGTTVNVSNFGSHVIAKSGGHFQIVISSTDFISITSDSPILIVQMIRSQQYASSVETADPSMTVIYPIEQYASDYTFTTPHSSVHGSFTNYFQIVIKDSEKSGLRLDYAPLNSSTTWTSFVGSDYVGAQIPVSDGSHVVYHTSTIVTFGGFLYGYVQYESYSFPGGMRLAPVNAPCVSSASGVGDGLDNDCDGRIDEELCDGTNSDDDGDGLVDEDCAKDLALVDTENDGSTTTASTMGSASVLSTAGTIKTSEAAALTLEEETATTAMANLDTATSTDYRTDSATMASLVTVKTQEQENALAIQTTSACPCGWFSCGGDSGLCIEQSFLCNCRSDCPDDRDESYTIAGCSYARIYLCNKSGGISITPTCLQLAFVASLVAALSSIL